MNAPDSSLHGARAVRAQVALALGRELVVLAEHHVPFVNMKQRGEGQTGDQRARGLADDLPFQAAVNGLQAERVRERDHCTKASLALARRHASHALQAILDDLLVAHGRPPVAPATNMNAGLAAQSLNLKAGVVRQDDMIRRELAPGASLQLGVALQRVSGLRHVQRKTQVRGDVELYALVGQQAGAPKQRGFLKASEG